MSLVIDISSAENISADIPAFEDIERWAAVALQALDKTGVELSIYIASSAEQRGLNKQYRGKDKSTNVLSFPAESIPGVPQTHLGDITCCAEVIAQEAVEQGKILSHHWGHMIVHGVLHLSGYDHIDDPEAEEMEALETRLLAGLNIPNPYE